VKIVACLAWYDEPITFLDRCIRSLAGIADRIVAYDGAWQMFPHEDHLSPIEQTLRIYWTANQVGISPNVFRPHVEWGSQVAKRDALMREACDYGDWLFVIDGDEYVAEADPDKLRATLAETELDVASVTAKRTNGFAGVNVPQPIRRIYRASTGVSVEIAHNGYRTADGRWLHGDGAFCKMEPVCNTAPFVLLHHEKLNRGVERNEASMEYRKNRNRTQCERWRRR
jgi:hypothetical protein